jgi:endoglucanase
MSYGIKIHLLAFAVFTVLAAVSASATPVSEHGKLHVEGRYLMDEHNQKLTLRGMSFYWYQGTNNGNSSWGGQPGNAFYTQASINALANNWKANVARAAIGNVSWEASNALQMAKSMMDWANQAGIYIIIDNHSHWASEQANAAQTFFGDVSAYVKQKGYKHVIYEIFNEPEGQNWSTIKRYAEGVIPKIRANDPDGVIIVGTPGHSSDVASPKADPLTGSNAKNVMYAYHYYAMEPGHGAVLRNTVKAAWCADIPVFISEWGTTKANGATLGSGWQDSNNDLMSLVESMGLSWANWSLSNTGEESAALTGSDVSGGTTQSGAYIKNLIQKRNQGQSVSGVKISEVECSNSTAGSRDGKLYFGGNGYAVNWTNASGVNDSVYTGKANDYMLTNTASEFNVDFNLIWLPGPGLYSMQVRVGSTASGGKVTWSGDGLSSGEAEIPQTGSLTSFEDTEKKLLKISTDASETKLSFSFTTNGAENTSFLYVNANHLTHADSVDFGIIIPKLDGSGEAELNAKGDTVFVENPDFDFDQKPTPVLGAPVALRPSATARVFDIQGNLVAKFDLSGQPQGLPLQDVKNLTPGVYILNWQGQSRRIYVR